MQDRYKPGEPNKAEVAQLSWALKDRFQRAKEEDFRRAEGGWVSMLLTGIAHVKKCQVRGLTQDMGSMWQGQAPSQRDSGSGGHRSRVDANLGTAGACRMKLWKILHVLQFLVYVLEIPFLIW